MQALFAETDAAINKSKSMVLHNLSLGSVSYHQKGLERSLELESEYDRRSKRVIEKSAVKMAN